MPTLDSIDYSEADFTEASKHVPSYLKVSCAVSGYGRYSTYSSYNNRLGQGDTPSASFRSISSGKQSCDRMSAQSCHENYNGSPLNSHGPPVLCLENGDLNENTHFTLFPTGNSQLDGNYFLNLAKVDEHRLRCQCDKAERDIATDEVPEEACGKMRAAIGKTQLLTSRKMKKFADLCEKHKLPISGEPVTTWADLQGFWDMVHIQIDDLDDLFREIEIMRQNDWTEIPPLPLSAASSASSSPQSASMSSHSTTPSETPKHTPASRRRGLKQNSSADSLPDQALKVKAVAKTRDDARRKMLMEKRAAMKSAKGSTGSDVQIYLPESDSGTSI